MNLYELPAYEIGCAAARGVIWMNSSGDKQSNPYHRDTIEYRAWNLGFDTTLRAEQP